ncbi:DUF1064 domain-containing protein [Sinorhizobium psoraleae]|uniref:DUF1064 domain-containing protein n=1 Tax=Sinorhizobium psoraleae TaxID=520838 RepID=A0ABT4KD51_9HYPH|nr:DUF1064 domain-containing protein [Sinorhizobium psoraleae]MCZ4089296.1 DUF1064 domain-containing protein [Sinorhizobium psoraleae]
MTERMSAEEVPRDPAGVKASSKYRNRKTVVDGIKFDSKREARVLCFPEAVGARRPGRQVELQKPYALTVNGPLVCNYRCDFAFYDAIPKRNRVVDIKGVATKDFNIKRKLMQAVYGIDVEVIR